MTRYANRDDLTEETSRGSAGAFNEVRKALEPLGYYSASATHTVSQKARSDRAHCRRSGRAVRISEAK